MTLSPQQLEALRVVRDRGLAPKWPMMRRWLVQHGLIVIVEPQRAPSDRKGRARPKPPRRCELTDAGRAALEHTHGGEQ